MIFLGVDPGASGGIAILNDQGEILLARKTPETDQDLFELFNMTGLHGPTYSPQRHAVLERVSSSPQMGVTSAFTFGGSYRALRMALTAARIPFDQISPLRWQRVMGCLSHGDKNVTKQRAQQLFPAARVTHATADALLLAEFCRRATAR
ncbi:MAG: hypothetical protein Q7J25_12315 [Vicinamibacterales bacterium]|nr:hypothetical protein [Vicinamibacterales bacterium]